MNSVINVSVIVPIYNAEKYIERCIDSILKQTLTNIELILINDGSTDYSLKICKRYREQDSRIVLVDKENNGVSSARNKGLEIAKGKYIAFVDADDYINKNMYNEMLTRIKGDKSDLCICNSIIEDKKILKVSNKIEEAVLENRKDIMERIVFPLIGPTKVMGNDALLSFRGPVNYMYKKAIIKDNNITFKEDFIIGEDFLFNLEYLSKINKVSISSKYFYHYCINRQSAMQVYRENWWEIHRKLIREIDYKKDFFSLYENERVRFENMIFNYFIGAINNESRSNKKVKDIVNKIEEISNEEIIRNILYDIDYTHLTLKRKIWFKMILNHKFSLLVIYYKTIEKLGR